MAPAAAAMTMNGVGDKAASTIAGGLKGLESQLAGLSMANSSSSAMPAQTSSATPGASLTSKETIEGSTDATSSTSTNQSGAVGDHETNQKGSNDIGGSGHQSQGSHELSNEQSIDPANKTCHRDDQEPMGRTSEPSHITNGDDAEDGRPCDSSEGTISQQQQHTR